MSQSAAIIIPIGVNAAPPNRALEATLAEEAEQARRQALIRHSKGYRKHVRRRNTSAP